MSREISNLIARLEAASGPDRTTARTIQKIRNAFRDTPRIVATLKAKEATHDK